MSEEKCKACGGTGKRDVYPGGGFGLNPGNRPSGTKPCPICKGTGKVNE